MRWLARKGECVGSPLLRIVGLVHSVSVEIVHASLSDAFRMTALRVDDGVAVVLLVVAGAVEDSDRVGEQVGDRFEGFYCAFGAAGEI